MYKVIVPFTDLQDDHYKYVPGDIFPRSGYEVSEERLKELSTDANRRRRPMIELVSKKPVIEEKKEPVEDFMNPPVEPINEEPVKEEKKPVKRGRRKKDAE